MKSRIWEKKEGDDAKTFAKIQLTAIFLIQDVRRNFFPRIYSGNFYGDALLGGGRKPTETSVAEFCY